MEIQWWPIIDPFCNEHKNLSIVKFPSGAIFKLLPHLVDIDSWAMASDRDSASGRLRVCLYFPLLICTFVRSLHFLFVRPLFAHIFVDVFLGIIHFVYDLSCHNICLPCRLFDVMYMHLLYFFYLSAICSCVRLFRWATVRPSVCRNFYFSLISSFVHLFVLAFVHFCAYSSALSSYSMRSLLIKVFSSVCLPVQPTPFLTFLPVQLYICLITRHSFLL